MDLPDNSKLLSTTWAMKKKVNGQYRGRITARGFLQEDGLHYFSHSTAAPVANELTIKIVLTLLTLADWQAQVIDVKGAFLKGRFTDGKKLYLKIPQGFEKMYSNDEVLHLNRTIYGLKQAAVAFWKELLEAFRTMGFQQSPADPCLYIKNTTNGLVFWISWVDDCILMGHQDEVSKYHKLMNNYFDCDNAVRKIDKSN
jgi:Reverse transcriptase (RNA-dependent DNA polymerase)